MHSFSDVLKNSVILKLTLIFTCFILIIESVFVYSTFKNIRELVVEETNSSVSHSLQKAASALDQLFTSIQLSAKTFSADEAFLEAINAQTSDAALKNHYTQTIDNRFLINLAKFPDHSLYFTAVSLTGTFYCSFSAETWEYRNQLSFQRYTDQCMEHGESWFCLDKNYLPRINNPQTGPLLTYASPIIDRNTLKPAGAIIISIPHQEIKNMLADLTSQPNSLFILSESDIPVLSLNIDEDLFQDFDLSYINALPEGYQYRFEEQDYLVHHLPLDSGSMALTELIPCGPMFERLTKLESQTFLLVFLSFILLLCLSILISVLTTRTLRQLSKNIEAAANGDLTIQMRVTSKDEIGRLVSNFNILIRRIRGLLEDQKKTDEQLRQLEFEALQQQIRPHFILNTLNSIRWMAVLSQADGIRDMISALSSLLKTSIYTNDKYITLEREVQNLKDYIRLQKIRFNGLFQVQINVDEALCSCEVLKMIMQPIVENSLTHGLDLNSFDSIIKIDAFLDGSTLVLLIYDNGRGIEPQALDQLNRALNGVPGIHQGVGILNVHQRLRLTYGVSYGIQIISQPEKGTAVELRLPYIIKNTGGTDHA